MAVSINGTTNVITPTSAVQPTGSVLQVVSATKTDTASTTSTSFADTGLQVQITPSATSSKILLLSSFGAGISNTGYHTHFRIDGTTTTSVGDAGGSAIQGGMSTKCNSAAGVEAVSFNFLDSPDSTSQQTYKLQYKTTDGGVTVYIGRSHTQDGNTSNVISTLTAMEIAG